MVRHFRDASLDLKINILGKKFHSGYLTDTNLLNFKVGGLSGEKKKIKNNVMPAFWGI